jgi:DNA-binding MarR family transcriptional regulator
MNAKLHRTRKVEGKRSAQSGHLTVTIPSLIHQGRDEDFGEMIALMYATLGRLQTLRRFLAHSLGLSSSEFAVVITLLRASHGTGMRIRRIADELYVAAANVTATVVKLERMGWVTKKPDDSDSRAVSIQLTQKARAKLNGFAGTLNSVNNIWFQGTTAGEFKAVVTFFKHLIEHYGPALHVARENARRSGHRVRTD